MRHRSYHGLEEKLRVNEHSQQLDRGLYPVRSQPDYKSGSEEIIGKILEEEGIGFTYEKPLIVQEPNSKATQARVWHPDFSLHESGVVIEYAGLIDDPEYMKGVEKKKAVYEAMGIPVVWLYPEDLWEKSAGKYRPRADAKEHVLEKVLGVVGEGGKRNGYQDMSPKRNEYAARYSGFAA